jgi:transcriptional regulator with XRE-family HTH domain
MDEKLKELFSKNLVEQLLAKGETQASMARYMKISSATASDWCNGRKMPRVDKIQALCNWLGIELSELLEEKKDVQTNGQKSEYYLDEETREMLQFLDENPEYKRILSSSRKLKPEDLAIIKAMIERFS